MPDQISYLGKFWFLRYAPKCSCPMRFQDFFKSTKFPEHFLMKNLDFLMSIQIHRSGCRTQKLAAFHKEINGINWLLVC